MPKKQKVKPHLVTKPKVPSPPRMVECGCVHHDCGDCGEEYGMSSGPFDVTWVLVRQDNGQHDYALRECGQCYGAGEFLYQEK